MDTSPIWGRGSAPGGPHPLILGLGTSEEGKKGELRRNRSTDTGGKIDGALPCRCKFNLPVFCQDRFAASSCLSGPLPSPQSPTPGADNPGLADWMEEERVGGNWLARACEHGINW